MSAKPEPKPRLFVILTAEMEQALLLLQPQLGQLLLGQPLLAQLLLGQPLLVQPLLVQRLLLLEALRAHHPEPLEIVSIDSDARLLYHLLTPLSFLFFLTHNSTFSSFSRYTAHFLSWTGEYFDFMGACDVVLAQSTNFGHGLGFAAHVRLAARYEYSYIESAAVQIGDDILEVSAYGHYMLNGVHGADLPYLMGDMYSVHRTVNPKNTKDISFDITLDGRQAVSVRAFKDLVSVRFHTVAEESFGDVVGIMGDFQQGRHLARDGKTLMNDDNDAFGQEWQVRPGQDPELFMAKSPIQYPASKCVIPSHVMDERRHLGESISVEDATAACEKNFFTKGAIEACIYDVIATGDLEAANAGAF